MANLCIWYKLGIFMLSILSVSAFKSSRCHYQIEETGITGFKHCGNRGCCNQNTANPCCSQTNPDVDADVNGSKAQSLSVGTMVGIIIGCLTGSCMFISVIVCIINCVKQHRKVAEQESPQRSIYAITTQRSNSPQDSSLRGSSSRSRQGTSRNTGTDSDMELHENIVLHQLDSPPSYSEVMSNNSRYVTNNGSLQANMVQVINERTTHCEPLNINVNTGLTTNCVASTAVPLDINVNTGLTTDCVANTEVQNDIPTNCVTDTDIPPSANTGVTTHSRDMRTRNSST